MANILDELLGPQKNEISQQLSSHLGLSPQTASEIIPAVAPLILGGLKRQMDTHGEQHVSQIVEKHGNPGALSNLTNFFASNSAQQSSDPTLGGLLGQSGYQAANALQTRFGLDSSTAMKLIPILAPIILGALQKKRQESGTTASAGNQGMTGFLGKFLDRNGDGQILDDVMGWFGGKGSPGQQNKGNGGDMGSILGGFFGKK